MDKLIEIVIIVAVIAFQNYAGHKGNKYLGAILPVIFIGFVIFIAIKGQLSFSFRDIFMPIIGIVVLIGCYEGGRNSQKQKVARELETMKAKDLSDNE